MRHQIQIKENIGNRITRQGPARNWKRTRSNKPRGPSRVYLTFHILIQQEEVWKVTRKKRMGPQNKSNKRCTQRIRCKGLCNDNQGKRVIEPMARWTVENRLNCRV